MKQRSAFITVLRQNLIGWKSYVLWQLGIKRPFTAKISGKSFEVRNEVQFMQLRHRLRLKLIDCEETEENQLDVLNFQFKGRVAKLYCYPDMEPWVRSTVDVVFRRECYGIVNFEGKDVVDIGANLGDSAIYFAMRGAKRVIALEPDPSLFLLAKKNIQFNGLTSKVLLLNEAVGDLSRDLDQPKVLHNANWRNASDQASEVHRSSLEDLVAEFSLNDAILKVDCVGCELGLILNSSDSALSMFSFLAIKYYDDLEEIRTRLIKAGYRIIKVTSYFVRNRSYRRHGRIFATL
ncbi:MAG: FkbM family methyltransferase [Nitrososphaerota archaeon]|nr:FkbM family methyltransferase [Nitrososphaerota archaeon]